MGKQQLVEIAKALSKDVKLLILDEPTAALNDTDSAHLLGLIRGLKDRGITSIIISHKLNEIDAIADHTTIIRDGQTVETLDMADPDRRRRPDHPAAWSAARWTPTTPSASRTRARRSCGSRTGPSSTPRQDRLVVDHASFDVRAGEVVGIAGLMGAGRTELAMSIFGRSYGTYVERPALPARQGDPRPAPSPRPSTPASPTPPRTARSTA